MTRIKLSLILALALALALPGLGRALDVPEGKAGVLEAVIGKVGVASGGKSLKAKVGLALDFGDSISTGPNGRVSIRHADNAVSRLAPNTELTLNAPGKQKGVFMTLKLGLIRFLVGKRAPGEVFQVNTANAVAAVKGTDADVETDGKTTRSAVFSSSRQKALEFLSNITGKSIYLAPGETAGLGEGGFDKRDLSDDDKRRNTLLFKGLPKPTVKEGGEGNDGKGGGQGNGNQGDDKDKDKDKDKDQGRGDEESFGDAISDAFAEAMNDMGLDDFLEQDQRTGDVVAGRIAYDRNGDRTQISSYVLRADDVTISKATYSKRETGPFKGTSYAEETVTWNKPLPEDWASVANRALDDAANLDSNGYAIYWKVDEYFEAGNPQGDLMQLLKFFEDPVYYPVPNQDANQDTYYTRGTLVSEQYYHELLYLNDQLVLALDYSSSASAGNSLLVADDPNLGYSPYGYPYVSINGSYTGQDNTQYSISYGDGYGSFLTTDIYVLQQDGTVLDQGALGLQPGGYLSAFRGLDNQLDIELAFRWDGMNAPIDLLVIPAIFDQMDFFDAPLNPGG